MHALGLRSARHLARTHDRRTGRAAAGRGGVDRPGLAHRAGRQAGREHARHRGADARGDAGDRGLQPPLCGERRALHDGDADVPLRHATPKTTPVTFILAGHRLVTVRYDEPRPFAIVEHKLARLCPPKISGESVLMDLLDAVIDRAADILERIGAEIDQISHTIFEPDEDRGRRPTTTCSRRSAARATSPRKCARAWSRSAACCCSWPTSRKA